MFLLNLLKALPKEWIVFITAAAPVVEVRGAVPIGILTLGLPPVKVVIISILGSIFPIIPLLWFLNFATKKLRHIKVFDNFFEWLFARTRAKGKLIEDFELAGLTLFVAIPFPGTGVWTGTIAAYLMGLPWLPTFICATIDTTIASLVLWAASVGIINFFL